MFVARQMIRQGLAAGFALGFTKWFTSSILIIGLWRCCPRDLFVFKGQLKLIKGFGGTVRAKFRIPEMAVQPPRSNRKNRGKSMVAKYESGARAE